MEESPRTLSKRVAREIIDETDTSTEAIVYAILLGLGEVSTAIDGIARAMWDRS